MCWWKSTKKPVTYAVQFELTLTAHVVVPVDGQMEGYMHAMLSSLLDMDNMQKTGSVRYQRYLLELRSVSDHELRQSVDDAALGGGFRESDGGHGGGQVEGGRARVMRVVSAPAARGREDLALEREHRKYKNS